MAKKKNKFPEARDFQSAVVKENRLETYVYVSDPGVTFALKGGFPENVISDLKHAIDEVLKYHGL